MENVFLDLRLDDFWDHPDNRGWAVVFMRWAGSSKPAQDMEQVAQHLQNSLRVFFAKRASGAA
jgi:hypothetical protein